MSAVDYLLHESSVGYAIFQVMHQADTIGNRLKEVQDASQDLAKFGKMVKLVNFAPYRYTIIDPGVLIRLTFLQRSC
jgi:nucleolar protein 56